MPVLNFKGKNAVWNHHLSVPYQSLVKDEKLSLKGIGSEENLIIEGDNLIALKSLLPRYHGRIRCIYIDPPYNLGSEWVYNDQVNSPLIREWIKKTVGADDLTKHDKWLCMMAPRLKLLQELLDDKGAIFISVDNTELYNLISLMNEIFLPENFVGVLIWRKKQGGGQSDAYFVTEHEYVVVYKKSEQFKWLDEVIPQDNTSFNKKDKDGEYKAVKLAKWGVGARKEDRPTMCFPISAPDGKKVYAIAPDGSEGRWRIGKKRMDELIENSLITWIKDDKGRWIPYEKIYFNGEEVKVIKERSILFDLAFTGDGTKELLELFGVKDIFDNPKPSELIKYLITYTTEEDSIVLDSFAGSGTTGHAVLRLNKEDKKSKRKFILIQLPEEIQKDKSAYKAGYRFIHEITRERVKRAIRKDKFNEGFSYMRLGSKIDADSILSGSLPSYKEFAKYIYYLATGKIMSNDKSIREKDFFVGSSSGESIYLIYEKDKKKLKTLAVTLGWVEDINKKDKNKKLVYAPACFLDEEHLEKFNISYVSIPYNIFEKK